jgi:hypothetical protein
MAAIRNLAIAIMKIAKARQYRRDRPGPCDLSNFHN